MMRTASDKEKEKVKRALEVTAKKLALKAYQLVVVAKEKEKTRKELVVTAKKLRHKAKKLSVLAKEKERVREKLAVTAGKLRLKAHQFVVVAKEKERTRKELAVTAGKLKKLYATLGQRVRDRTEALENARVAARNVLEDLQVEKGKLAEAKAKDEAMLASIGDGVVIVDLAGKITFINEAAQELLGWRSEEILGKFLFDTVPIENEKGELIPADVRPMAIALTTGAVTAEVEKELSVFSKKAAQGIYFLRKDKTKFPVAMNFSRVLLNDKVVGAIEVFRDITKEKEIDRAKTEFVSLASHQLKTPPTAIKLLTERILSGRIGSLTARQREYLSDIRSSNQRMIDLVNTLLSVSRIEMGTFAIEPHKKNMCVLIRSILDELTLAMKNKKMHLQQTFPKKNLTVSVDESLFRMVINNLVMNAVNYTPEGGTIRVECKKMNQGQTLGGKMLRENSFVAMVIDNGCGIPKNQQAKLFTKFFRADNAGEKNPNGTGLGLYIVKSILDNSGGSIWLTSEEHKGTEFYVSIPMTGMKAKVDTKRL